MSACQEDSQPGWHDRDKPSLRSREEARYGPMRCRHEARTEAKKGSSREAQNRMGEHLKELREDLDNIRRIVQYRANSLRDLLTQEEAA